MNWSLVAGDLDLFLIKCVCIVCSDMEGDSPGATALTNLNIRQAYIWTTYPCKLLLSLIIFSHFYTLREAPADYLVHSLVLSNSSSIPFVLICIV